MRQYKHQNIEFKEPESDKVKTLETRVRELTDQVQQLQQRVEFLQRQDQRSRSSFEQIQARINSRK
jgi:chaperonin cofactor prefoldin